MTFFSIFLHNSTYCYVEFPFKLFAEIVKKGTFCKLCIKLYLFCLFSRFIKQRFRTVPLHPILYIRANEDPVEVTLKNTDGNFKMKSPAAILYYLPPKRFQMWKWYFVTKIICFYCKEILKILRILGIQARVCNIRLLNFFQEFT